MCTYDVRKYEYAACTCLSRCSFFFGRTRHVHACVQTMKQHVVEVEVSECTVSSQPLLCPSNMDLFLCLKLPRSVSLFWSFREALLQRVAEYLLLANIFR